MTCVLHETGSGSLYAGLEAGGSKCVCAVGTGPDDIRACTQFATTTPSETMAHALAPQRIIMGGGVMHQAHLFPRLRHEVRQLLNDYIQIPELHDQLDGYIVPPRLGDQAGVLGALVLAQTGH